MTEPGPSEPNASPHFVPGRAEMAMALILLPMTAARMEAQAPLAIFGQMQRFQTLCFKAVDAHGGEAVRVQGTSMLAAWKAGSDGFPAACGRACRAAREAVSQKGGKKKAEPLPGILAVVCGGSCDFFTRDGRIVNIAGEPVVRLERFAKLGEASAGRVLVDENIRAAAGELGFERLAGEEDEIYVLAGVDG